MAKCWALSTIFLAMKAAARMLVMAVRNKMMEARIRRSLFCTDLKV